MKYCTVCQEKGEEKGELKNLDLYVIGSEGTQVCHGCEMLIVGFMQLLMKVAGKSRKLGYQNAKDVQASREECGL